MANQIETSWGFNPVLPSVDKRVDPSAVGIGLLTKGVGVDVRTMGSLRLMPGFRRLRSQSSGVDEGLTANGRIFPDADALGVAHDATVFLTVTDFRRFTVEKLYNNGGTLEPYKISGFWVRGTTDGTTSAEISLLQFHDGQTDLWNQYVLEIGTAGSGIATDPAWIAVFGNFLYYCRQGIDPQVWYWDTNNDTPAFVLNTMGPGIPIPREVPTVIDRDGSGGVLKDGSYLLAYRYANKHRWQYTSMSDTVEVQIPQTNDPAIVTGVLSFSVHCSAGIIIKGSSTASFTIETEIDGDATGVGGRIPGSCIVSIPFNWGEDILPVERLTGTRILITGPTDPEFRTVQIFRSISAESVGAFNGGVLYLEHEFDMPEAVTSTEGRDENGAWDRGHGKWERWVGDDGLDPGYEEAPNDEVLVSIADARYDPVRDAVGAPPKSGVVAVFDETTFMVDPGDAEGRTLADIRWSSLSKRAPESFPELDHYRYTPPDPDDAVLRFVPVDKVMVGFSDTHMYQIELAAGGIRLEPVQGSFGPVDHRAVVPVGGRVILVHSLGAGEVDSRSMDLANIVALDRRIQNEWGDTLDDVRLCYDARYGGVYILNTATREMSVIGVNSNAIAEVEDANFVACTEGLQPDDPTPGQSAFFITDRGLVVYPDAARQNAKGTLIELTGTTSGTLTTGSGGVTLIDSAATFHDDPVDCIVHLFDPDRVEYTATVIARVSPTTLQLEGAPAAMAVGWSYELSPIPFDVQFWKLGESNDPRSPDDRMRVRTATAVKVLFDGLGGSGLVGAVATIGLVKGSASVVFDSSGEVSIAETAYNLPVETSSYGPLIFPRVRIVRSDVRFDLLSLLVEGRVESTYMTER